MAQSKQDNATIQAMQKSNVSRYIQLASLFRKRIETGEWDVGERIPTIKELSDQCGVATMTIRQALGQLENEGLIERFRAKGTFVTQRPARDLWCEVRTDWSGMLIARDDAAIEILENTSGQKLPNYEGDIGNASQSYRHLRRRHSRDGVPFMIADIYIDERLSPMIDEESYGKVTALRLISEIEEFPIADATQIVTIGSADLDIANELNISIGDPLARVQRLAVDAAGDVLLLAKGIYRGDMMKIEVKLK